MQTQIVVLCVMTPCSLVGGYHRGEVHFYPADEDSGILQHDYLLTRLNGVTSLKTIIFTYAIK
jgi:hypothetical protein